MGLKDFRWESRFLWKNGDKIGASEIKGKKHQKGKMTFFSRKGKQRGEISFHFDSFAYRTWQTLWMKKLTIYYNM